MDSIQIHSLNNRHYKIIEYCLRGWKNNQIAETLGITGGAVSIIVNSPSFQHELATRRSQYNERFDESAIQADDEVTETIRKGAKDAATKLCQLVNSPDEQVAARAIENVLDRSGYPRIQKTEQKSLSVVLSGEDIARLNESLDLIGD